MRNHFPNIPIFNITGKYLSDQETDMIAEATLEDVDGILLKNYLEGDSFSAKRLKKIFDKSNIKRKKYSVISVHNYVEGIPDKVKTDYNFNSLDARVKSQIVEIGEAQFWNLLLLLLPGSQGTISFMKPGRSGAYVFKVKAKFKEEGKSPTLPKGWIVKITNKKELLEREVKNHSELIKSLPRATYPILLTQQPVVFNNLAGIALELEEYSSSLMECFGKLKIDETDTIIKNMSSILKSLYGDSTKKQIALWKEVYSLREDGVIKILSFFEESDNILQAKINKEHKKRIITLLMNDIADEAIKNILNLHVEADMRNIHGDFNSRNILVNENRNLVLIDFSAREQNHVAKDIAKLERDIVFRVFDAFSPNYFDWNRIETWHKFMSLNIKGNIFAGKRQFEVNDTELKKSMNFIYGIRNILKQISPELEEKQYLCALLHFSLLAIAHPEISIQKKIFAVQYINQILENFE